MEWSSDRMDFFFDQTRYHAFPIEKAEEPGQTNAFHKSRYLLITFALGGSWGRQIDDSILPQKFPIDYVRVYQKPGPARPPSRPRPTDRLDQLERQRYRL
jgi:hypothetical protein